MELSFDYSVYSAKSKRSNFSPKNQAATSFWFHGRVDHNSHHFNYVTSGLTTGMLVKSLPVGVSQVSIRKEQGGIKEDRTNVPTIKRCKKIIGIIVWPTDRILCEPKWLVFIQSSGQG